MIQWHELAGFGFSVFPVKARDKRPLGPWERYQKERAAHSELCLWERAPHLNAGIATGELSGIFVVDLDSEEATRAFYKKGFPRTPMVTTGKGQHIYFRYPDFPVKNSAGKLGPGIDVRGEGGFVLAPGSVHPNGRTYEWYLSPAKVEIAAAPDWLLDALVAPQRDSFGRVPGDEAGEDPEVACVVDNEMAKLRAAETGTRNNTLNVAALKLGQLVGSGTISEDWARRRLFTEAVYVGLPDAEARATITSGMRKGKAEPRTLTGRVAPAPVPEQNPNWLDEGVDADELGRTTFEPIRWVVPGVIVEGTTLLGARPKRGKSWLMLGCAVGVASGGMALGERCEEGDVLGLFLEDNRRRLNSRMAQLMGDAPWPKRLKFFTLENNFPRLDEGGLERIEQWIERVERPRFVILDVLTKVRPRGDKNRTLYENDYEALKGLTELALRKRIAIAAVHHCRKTPADEDPFDELSGTTGLTGAANTTLVLKRGEGRTDILYGRGHDVPEFEKALSFDPTRGLWTVLGDADEYRGNEIERKIRAVFEDAGRALGPKEILEALGGDLSYDALRKRLNRMVRTGILTKDDRGRYAM